MGGSTGKKVAAIIAARWATYSGDSDAVSAEHGIVSEIELIPILKINEAFDRLLKGT